MHTMLINDYNMIVTTNAERIVQKTKNAHQICIRAKNEYNGKKMNECLAFLFYTLPISRKSRAIELKPSEELYKGTYVEYIFDADTWLTQEYGDVEIEIKFYNATLNGYIEVEQYVRRGTDGIIHISKSKDWAAGIADGLLDTIDQKIIELKMAQNRQDEMIAESIMNSAATLKVEDGKLYLVNNVGEKMGDAADVVVPRIPDVNDGADDGVIEVDDSAPDKEENGCDCGCDCNHNDSFVDVDDSTPEDSIESPDDDENGFIEV